jgi:hypothetical protein
MMRATLDAHLATWSLIVLASSCGSMHLAAVLQQDTQLVHCRTAR